MLSECQDYNVLNILQVYTSSNLMNQQVLTVNVYVLNSVPLQDQKKTYTVGFEQVVSQCALGVLGFEGQSGLGELSRN